MNNYLAGNLVTVSAVFEDGNTLAFVDPTEVLLTVSPNAGPISTSTYTSGALTGPYAIVKDSVGHYHAEIDTTGTSGIWAYQWSGTGTAQAVTRSSFNATGPAL